MVRIQDRNPSQCIGAIDNFFIVYRCHAQAPFDCGSRESGIAQSCAPESVALYISSHRTARKKTHVWWDVSREEATTISSVNMIIWQFIIYQSNNIQWYRVTWHRVTEPGTSQGGHEPRAEYRERERERETEREREREEGEVRETVAFSFHRIIWHNLFAVHAGAWSHHCLVRASQRAMDFPHVVCAAVMYRDCQSSVITSIYMCVTIDISVPISAMNGWVNPC